MMTDHGIILLASKQFSSTGVEYEVRKAMVVWIAGSCAICTREKSMVGSAGTRSVAGNIAGGVHSSGCQLQLPGCVRRVRCVVPAAPRVVRVEVIADGPERVERELCALCRRSGAIHGEDEA